MCCQGEKNRAFKMRNQSQHMYNGIVTEIERILPAGGDTLAILSPMKSTAIPYDTAICSKR
jgi:hypothetical protein